MLYKHKRGEAVYLLKDNKPVMHIHIDGNYYPIDLEVFNCFQEQSNRIRAEARAEALKEAADRLLNSKDGNVIDTETGLLKPIIDIILADEPKELECSTCGRKESAPYEEGDSCYCGGKFFADEPKEQRGIEEARL